MGVWRSNGNLKVTRRASSYRSMCRGTAPQVRVWAFLQRIPRGEVRSYADVATGIGKPGVTRAVGSRAARTQSRRLRGLLCHAPPRQKFRRHAHEWPTRATTNDYNPYVVENRSQFAAFTAF